MKRKENKQDELKSEERKSEERTNTLTANMINNYNRIKYIYLLGGKQTLTRTKNTLRCINLFFTFSLKFMKKRKMVEKEFQPQYLLPGT